MKIVLIALMFALTGVCAEKARGCRIDIGSNWIHIYLNDIDGHTYLITQSNRHVNQAWNTCNDWLHAKTPKRLKKQQKTNHVVQRNK